MSVIFLPLLLAAAGRPEATAREPIGPLLDRLEAVRPFLGTAISPAGDVYAWVEEEGSRRETRIVLETKGGTPRPLTAGRDGKVHREGEIVFSPDGASVAFLSDALTPGQLEVYVAPVSSLAPKALTHVQGQLDHLAFSPDGKSLAVLFVKGSSQETGALVAYRPDSGPVGEEPEDEQRVAIIDAATGAFKEIGPEKVFVYDYDWTRDSAGIVAETTEGSGTNNYWLGELDLIDVKTGGLKRLWKPPLQIACPRVSPDGKTVAVIHGIMSDEGQTGGDIYTVSLAGGAAQNLTPGMRASARDLAFDSQGNIVFLESIAGEMGIGRVGKGAPETLWKAPERIAHVAMSRDGTRMVVVADSITVPPEVYGGPLGSWTALTHANAEAPHWGAPKDIHWTTDAGPVQGWLIPPKVVEPGRRYPMVVVVHGGPSAVASAGWPSNFSAVLPASGYFAFIPNFRGSYGQGEEFAAANVKDFGYGDFRDILAGVDTVLQSEPIDPKKLGILGWSYGGYMTMWAVTQTDRFAAAVAGAGVANFQSYYGQNRIDQWMIPFFGASVYDDPWIYARSSPITFIKATKTPTLVLHGDRDSEVPTPQGYEFWHAIKALGVPTELVIYEGEGHSFQKAAHRKDMLTRTIAWLDKYLAPGK
jgi:dipeptidyl aminopeptidase/acylaminoacyl peptidase